MVLHWPSRSRRLIRQLGDPSAQISGALADRAVVGMPADAAVVAHREGVLPGGNKRPQFLSKPVHVLQRGAEVNEIVNVAAIAVVDAQEAERRRAGARV